MVYESAAQALVAFGIAMAAMLMTGGCVYLVLSLIEWLSKKSK